MAISPLKHYTYLFRVFCNIRMWQGKLLVVVLSFGLIIFVTFYIRFESEISRLDEARKKLANTVARLQLQNIMPAENKRTIPVLSPKGISFEDTIKDPFEDTIIIYNRVPKTGSTSFMGVAYDLCGHNNFHVLHINTTKNSHVLSLSDQMRFVQNITTWEAKKPALYHGHIAFLNFERFGITQKPIFINIIRKPLDRLVSYYYFLRNGDDFRPYLIRRRQGNKMSFDECVAKEEADCDPDNMWLQIPFFCGHMAECWIPGNEWALERAKQNLAQHYLLVGVTEEIQDFVALLEASLPRFFRGATKHFSGGKKSHLRKTFNKLEPSAETVAKVQESKIWKMESEFYDFALQQFHFIRKRTLKDGTIVDKGQRFMYEKIRPR